MPVSMTATTTVDEDPGWMSQARSMSMFSMFHCRRYSGSFGTKYGRTRYAACAYSTSGRLAKVLATASGSSFGSIEMVSKFAYGFCVVSAAVGDALESAESRALVD